jgi:hypothetical protein
MNTTVDLSSDRDQTFLSGFVDEKIKHSDDTSVQDTSALIVPVAIECRGELSTSVEVDKPSDDHSHSVYTGIKHIKKSVGPKKIGAKKLTSADVRIESFESVENRALKASSNTMTSSVFDKSGFYDTAFLCCILFTRFF